MYSKIVIVIKAIKNKINRIVVSFLSFVLETATFFDALQESFGLRISFQAF